MNKDEIIQQIVTKWSSKEIQFPVEQFLKRLVNFFQDHPLLTGEALPIIHSIKYRLKDPEHLRDKLLRKWDTSGPINPDNMFDRITDLAGIRILHLYQKQFPFIHAEIMKQIDSGEWCFAEAPTAYTWDPESTAFYRDLGIGCQLRDTYYTSIHYLLKPNETSFIRCEIQVRTLFEEIWGEIDHFINYPHSTQSIACKEQLRVLGKLASTGTRLADSIFASHEEYMSCQTIGKAVVEAAAGATGEDQ